MSKYYFLLIIIINSAPAFAQRLKVLSELKETLSVTKEDTTKVRIYADISSIYGYINEDSCYYYANLGFQLAQQIQYEKGEVLMLNQLGSYFTSVGNLSEALQTFNKAERIATKNKDQMGMALTLMGIGFLYRSYDPAITMNNLLQARQMIISEEIGFYKMLDIIDVNLGIGYMYANQLDSAFFYLNGLYQRTNPSDFMYAPALLFLGNLQAKMGHTNSAIELLKQSIEVAQQDNDYFTLSDSYYFLADIYNNLNIPDSAILFAQMSFENASLVSRKDLMIKSAKLCAQLYEPVNPEISYEYLKTASTLNDEIYGTTKLRELQKLILEEQQYQLKVEQEQSQYKNRVRLFVVFGVLIVLASISLLQYQNNRKGKKLNAKLKSALDHLKATQSQLIQSEKMASLGELTAGIAHEIQNPLNFVNNFSEVNSELIDELKKELAVGNRQLAEEIADDVKANEEKILHHGKRADAIVKGMLQHSHSSSGQKESIDINALCDEYLRLSYHGLRAKDKSFNAKFETDFDSSLPKINVVPQDIGRVILNLINNAFYVVNEKAKQGIAGYEPTVYVSTKLSPAGGGKGVEISVKDNGPGISDSIKDKIFQPFFTTKPTGQGTGLGLSLSYDIVKAHGGEIKVNTKENEGTIFTIQIPLL